MAKMHYAFKDGELVSIEIVESGLKCNCVCPSCKQILIARKGKKNEHHFAHYQVGDCGKGGESALHLMAKKIICETQRAYIPAEDDEIEGQVRKFAKVNVEPRMYEGLIPDIIAYGKERELNIEILVTHAVDDNKLEKIKKAQLETIEIDLSAYLEDYDETIVENAICSGAHTKWLFNKKIEEKKRITFAKDSVCDFLPNISFFSGTSKNNIRVYCPMTTAIVGLDYGKDSCHECYYFEHNNSVCASNEMPCNYREKDIEQENISDIRNLKREDGKITEIDIYKNGKWEHWCGYPHSLLYKDVVPQSVPRNSFETKPSENEKEVTTLRELWKPTYKAMGVMNITNESYMIINRGENGEMQKSYQIPENAEKPIDGRLSVPDAFLYLKWEDKTIGIIDERYNVKFLYPRYNEVLSLYTGGRNEWSHDEFVSFLSERVVSRDRRDKAV